jgi:hypothetical protein
MKQASNINEFQAANAEGTQGLQYGWFFDAFIRESHTGSVRITDHPVQGGANISDHAYNLPDKLTLEIFVSDVMDTLVVGQFKYYETKSISAYEVLRRLKEQRQPLSVRTKLHYYENMIIESMTINDDFKTAKSLRCTVMMREIIMAQMAKETAVAANPYIDATDTGVSTPTPATGAVADRLADTGVATTSVAP